MAKVESIKERLTRLEAIEARLVKVEKELLRLEKMILTTAKAGILVIDELQDMQAKMKGGK